MSHEIRTPMNGVHRDDRAAARHRARRRAARVRRDRRAARPRRCSTIINDILDFSKIEAGKLELESIDFDLRELIEDVDASCSPPWRSDARASSSSRAVAPDVPAALVGDPGRLRQVLINLRRQRASSSPSAGEVDASRVAAERDGATPRVRFAVTRHRHRHPRRAARAALRAVHPGRRVDDAHATAAPASGSRSRKRLVELMGGRIGVESEAGPGQHVLVHRCRSSARRPRRDAIAPSAGPDCAALRVLVVDDNATNRADPRASSWRALGRWPASRRRRRRARRCAPRRARRRRRSTSPCSTSSMPGMDGARARARASRRRRRPCATLLADARSSATGDATRRRTRPASPRALTKPVAPVAAARRASATRARDAGGRRSARRRRRRRASRAGAGAARPGGRGQPGEPEVAARDARASSATACDVAANGRRGGRRRAPARPTTSC